MSAAHLIRPLALAAAIALPATALAHHGWSWTQDSFFELEGRISAMSFANPHPMLEVEADGATWQVELAPPAATARAGFTQDVASVGDAVTAIGHRSRDANETRMKAVRLVIDGRNFDIYPGRLPPA